MNSNAVLAGLAKVGALVAEAIRRKAQANNVPRVPDCVTVSPPILLPQTQGATIPNASVDVVIDISEEGAPAAAAYEWGSGERAESGNKGRIKIIANEAPQLAWPKEDWPQYDPDFFGPGQPGAQPEWHYFPGVMHPGVFPRPYIRPTIRDTLPQVKQILGQAVKAQLLLRLKEIQTFGDDLK